MVNLLLLILICKWQMVHIMRNKIQETLCRKKSNKNEFDLNMLDKIVSKSA